LIEYPLLLLQVFVCAKEILVVPESLRLLHREFEELLVARDTELAVVLDPEDQVLEPEKLELAIATLAFSDYRLRDLRHLQHVLAKPRVDLLVPIDDGLQRLDLLFVNLHLLRHERFTLGEPSPGKALLKVIQQLIVRLARFTRYDGVRRFGAGNHHLQGAYLHLLLAKRALGGLQDHQFSHLIVPTLQVF
jgi:hypothetical protein